MSSGVTQIGYWREVNEPKKNEGKTNVSEGGPGAQYLSYNVLLGLTVLGGFFALDHLYLRSPLTFLAKIAVNIFFLGTWWLYDASQVVFNRDVVRVYGLGIPGLGPKAIGGGCLASNTPDKKHMAFFIYALAILLGGIFGLDSFLVGDKQSGIIRLVCLLTGILAPIALIWWLFNLFKFLFQTKDVTNMYWEYFGAPQPAEETMTLGQKLVKKFPFLERFFGPAQKVKEVVVKTATGIGTGAVKFAEAVVEDPTTLITAPIDLAAKPIEKIGDKVDEVSDKISQVAVKPLQKIGDKVGEISEQLTEVATGPAQQAAAAVMAPITQAAETAMAPAIAAVQPLKNTVNTGLGVAQTGLNTAKQGLALGQTVVEAGKTVADKTLNVAGQTATAATQALTLAPAAAAMTSGLTPGAAQAALTTLEQKGGMILQQEGGSGLLPYVLVGTLGIIVVSGLVLTYRRLRQNEPPRKDDSPPEPGVLGKSDKKESNKASRPNSNN